MKICVPSSNRAGETTTTDVFHAAVVFVPENQTVEYRNSLENDIVPVPMSVNGITQTRNFILNHFKNECIVMIDDDVRECGVFQDGKRISYKNQSFENVFIEEFKRLFAITSQFGFKIWGCENGGSNRSNHPLLPFSFQGTITTNLMGIVNDGSIFFDEKFKLKEDYDLSLRHYKQFGGHLKTRAFYWRNHNFTKKGGCVDYRTDETEEQSIAMLKQRHGMMIGSGRKNKHAITVKWD